LCTHRSNASVTAGSVLVVLVVLVDGSVGGSVTAAVVGSTVVLVDDVEDGAVARESTVLTPADPLEQATSNAASTTAPIRSGLTGSGPEG
jgi:hypothetical protein